MPRMRILFVTTGLAVGGAEMMLFKLLCRLDGSAIEAAVVSLMGPGPVSVKLETLGVPVWHLGLEKPWRLASAPLRLARIARRFNPDVVQGWMYHGNLAARLAEAFASDHTALVWGIRQSLYDLWREKPLTHLAIRIGARLSRRVDALVYNSQTSRDQHEAKGYDGRHARVIDNGFDTEVFRPDSPARVSVRNEFGILPEAPLIGFIARYHPMKGHDIFLRAASILARNRPEVHFLLAGMRVTAGHPVFASRLYVPELAGRVHLLGERQDIPRLMAALDLASSSSWEEAFANAIGEAMSCAVPCVVTDVGDSRRIVGDTGRVVPAGDADALARAWNEILTLSVLERQALGEAARRRVLEFFSLDEVARRYAALYREVAKDA